MQRVLLLLNLILEDLARTMLSYYKNVCRGLKEVARKNRDLGNRLDCGSRFLLNRREEGV